ncbi:unnamed protein product [Symbiodinium natans]|uniref:CS domain-containing protein n=1 Tax=Symbiodinium natans TaxID=878477 RepID=A0A812QMT4_9DINO|nr:unnamed protein product [Symbiodinium natans]
MSTLKPALPRAESELGRNRESKGTNSYYYAHNEGWEVPDHAKVRAGPGLVTGGAPVKLGADGQPKDAGYPGSEHDGEGAQAEVVAELRRRVEELEGQLMQVRASARPITQFSFSDEGVKCKVYVDVEKDILERQTVEEGVCTTHEAAVVVSFFERSCSIRVAVPGADGLAVERRALTLVGDSDLVLEKCSYKVDRSKGRITISFYKKDEKKRWQSVKPQKT